MVEKIRVGILTISDRCSRGEQEDISGKEIEKALPSDTYVVALYAVIPDEKKAISDTLKRWTDIYDCALILTTGGTGFSKRDITPEATLRVLDRQASGLVHLLLSASDHKYSYLSRPVAGIRAETIIINLPGSPSGAKEGVHSLLGVLPHAVDVLRDHSAEHPSPC